MNELIIWCLFCAAMLFSAAICELSDYIERKREDARAKRIKRNVRRRRWLYLARGI